MVHQSEGSILFQQDDLEKMVRWALENGEPVVVVGKNRQKAVSGKQGWIARMDQLFGMSWSVDKEVL